MSARYRRCFAIFVLIFYGIIAAPSVFAETTYSFNLPEQSLADSLRAIGQQTEMNILFEPDAVKNTRSPALRGQYTVDEAIRLVLAGTKLEAQHTAASNLVIKVKSARSTSAVIDHVNQGKPKKDSSQDFRVAQVDQGGNGSDVPVEENEKGKKKKTEGLEEIVVTGSRIPTVAGQQVVPVRSYTKEDIDRSGQTTVVGFLNNLPDVSTIGNDSIVGVAGTSTTVQLHGFPAGTTLVLLNGRRVEINPEAGVFDLGNIPVSAIERVEVLPVGASAIYGADALAGAVNIVLRQNLNGFEASGKISHAAGVNSQTFNIAWGKSWEQGAISLIGTYQDQGGLLGSRRTPTSSINFPSNAPTSNYISDTCSPGNVYSLNGQNLPGLSSTEAGIPVGISGTPTIGLFVPTAGKLNLCNYYRNTSLITPSKKEGVILSGHYEVADSLDLFSEVIFTHEHLMASDVPLIAPEQATLAATNPYNPFGEAVGVSFAYEGLPSQYDSSKYFVRPLIGVRGTFLSDWHYEATAFLSHDRYTTDYRFSETSSVETAALASSDPATALNPFTAGAPGSPELLQSILASAALLNAVYDSRLIEGQIVLRGPLFQLPAGPLEAVVGTEYGQEKQENRQLIPAFGSTTDTNLSRDSYAAFTEARVPLLAGQANRPFYDELTLTLAGRFDHTNDFGGKATWQGGLLWRPTETISLTGSYGLSYQAPQLEDIGGGVQFAYQRNLADPLRGGQVTSANIIYGSNPNLHPETGNSRTFGIAYSSHALQGFRASLTYFDLNVSNYIGRFDPLTIVANPNLFSSLIARGPPSLQDQQQGFPGPITQINQSPFNFGDLRVTGFDADMRYAMDTRVGIITPSIALANIFRWQAALLPGSPSADYVSQATYSSGPGFAPRWKGTAALSWKQGPFAANITGRYLGRYTDYQYFVPNSNELGNDWLFDLNIRYDLGKAISGSNGWLAGSYASIGAINLFNKTPPFSYNFIPYDDKEYTLLGRFVYAELGVKW